MTRPGSWSSLLPALALLLLASTGCPEEEPIVPPAEAIDPAALPPLPPGPPPRKAEALAAGDPREITEATREQLRRIEAVSELEVAGAQEGSWASGRAVAAQLVPRDARVALLIASLGGLLDDAGALMDELKAAGVHSRFDVGYADGLRKAMGTPELGGEALAADGLISAAPAALWWRPGAWVAVLPLSPEGLPAGLLERAMRIRAGWPGAACKAGTARAGGLDLSLCREGRRIALFLAVRGEHLLVGGADDLAALRGAVAPPRETLAGRVEREALPEVDAPLELFAGGLTALWEGALRVGLRIQAGGITARGRATTETLLLEEGSAPFAALEVVPSSLLLRARLRGAGQLASSLGVSAALTALCPGCRTKADREAEAALTGLLGGEVALLLQGFEPQLLQARPGKGALPPEVVALKGFEQLWVARCVGERGEAAAALEALVKHLGGRGVEAEGLGTPEAPRYRLRRMKGPGAPLEVELGLAGEQLYLSTRPELTLALGQLGASGGGERGRAFSLRLDPVQLASAIDAERLPDPPTSLAEALLVYGLELARSSQEPLPWRVELWPVELEAGPALELEVDLPSPRAPSSSRASRP
ncbi:MAG: hypothetical protein P1V51_25095 [Deltaproteobacteria bacterium]|nr:hypothetical protein [Deltaproteobacteria bacterium]